MKLNHLNIAVPDVAATRSFFESFFGLRCVETRGQDVLSVLAGEDGFVLILSNFKKDLVPEYPRDFHVGFLLRDSVDEVNRLYERVKSSGFEASPPKNFHGSWVFYVTAPGGFTVEVSSYPNGALPAPVAPVA